MSDKPTNTPRRKRPTRREMDAAAAAVAGTQPQQIDVETVSVAAPRLAETSSTNEKIAALSLREGGLRPSEHEILIMLGNVPLVVDTSVLRTAVAGLLLAEEPSVWFEAHRALIQSVVFTPVAPRIARAFPLLSAKATISENGASHDWPVLRHMPGLHLVVGGTSAGKSVWLSKQGADVTIRWGEPAEVYDLDPSSIQVADILEALAVGLTLASAGFRVAIDSFRNLVFGVTGAAGPGGVSVELYSALTSINNVCAQLDVLLVALVNPMSEGEKAQLVYNNIAASVAGMTVVDNGALVSQTARTFGGRVFGDGTPRLSTSKGPVDVFPHATRVREPQLTHPRARLDTLAIDSSDSDDVEKSRAGGKLHI